MSCRGRKRVWLKSLMQESKLAVRFCGKNAKGWALMAAFCGEHTGQEKLMAAEQINHFLSRRN